MQWAPLLWENYDPPLCWIIIKYVRAENTNIRHVPLMLLAEVLIVFAIRYRRSTQERNSSERLTRLSLATYVRVGWGLRRVCV